MRASRGCGLAGKGALLLTLISFVLLLPLYSQAGTYGDTYNSCLNDCTGPCCKEKCAYAACVAETVARGVGMKEMTDSRAWGEALRACSSQREQIAQCAKEHPAERRQARPAPPPPTVSRGMEYNVDRMGQDYENFDLPEADPGICQERCAADPKCMAWTYVKPNTIQGPRPRCWLKHSVPAPRESDCCVSGVKKAPPPPTRHVFSKPMVNRYRLDWCHKWATDCGQSAADAFCRSKGLRRAKAFEQDPDIGQKSPTYVLGTGQICDQGACDGFKFIECE
jgi:hypothetical protein